MYSAELEINLLKLKEECLLAKEFAEPVNASNRGGWQGKMPNDNNIELNKLINKTSEFVNFVAIKEQLNVKLYLTSSWININYPNNYNIAHYHGSTDMAAVFYVNAPHPVGYLHLLRNDGAQFKNIYINNSKELEFCVKPLAGRIYVFPAWLLHYVAPSPYSEDERISIAFNYNVIMDKNI